MTMSEQTCTGHIIPDELAEFLNDNKCLDEYRVEFSPFGGFDFNRWVKREWIYAAFDWDDATSGYDFWLGISDKWEELLA